MLTSSSVDLDRRLTVDFLLFDRWLFVVQVLLTHIFAQISFLQYIFAYFVSKWRIRTSLLFIATIVVDNPTIVFANILAIILKLAINTTNQLFPISATTVANTESIQPMALVSAKSKSYGSTITISTIDLQNIISNTICMVGNASYSSSLSISSGMSPSSWLMDFACCNHMRPHSSLFSQLEPAPHPLNIHTANGFTMFGHNIGSISTSNLSIPGVFNVPNLSYDLFSVGQLPELGYRITFDYSRCIVQDPRMGQEFRTSPRIGWMFLVDNLCLPSVTLVSIVAAVSSISSLTLWHARLGHASSSRVQHLVSRDLLGSVST